MGVGNVNKREHAGNAAKRRGAYWSAEFSAGEYVDKHNRFRYLREGGISEAGYRKIVVENVDTGEEFCATATYIINADASGSSSLSEKNRASSRKAIRKYHDGDIINSGDSAVEIVSLDDELYPPHVRRNGAKDRRGLFRNLVTGEEFEAILSRVTAGYTGKGGSFSSENMLAKALEGLGIEFERQVVFDSCIGFSNRPLRFDFLIKDKRMLIEFDGPQHCISGWKSLQIWHADDSDAKSEYFMHCARDILKESWCSRNSMNLLRISYLPPADITQETVSTILGYAEERFLEQGNRVVFYPDGAERGYESVKVVMSNLSNDDQLIFADHISDRGYRRPLDVGDDSELEAALPIDRNTAPVVFENGLSESPKVPSSSRRRYAPGDSVGSNGVVFLSDFQDGEFLGSDGRGQRIGLFRCLCGNEFTSTFSSVKGYGDYSGKVCKACTLRKTKERMGLIDRREITYKPGDVVDPDGKFEFVEEVEPNRSGGRKLKVRERDSGEISVHQMSTLRRGIIRTQSEKEESRTRKAPMAADNNRKTYAKGDTICNQHGIFEVIEDIEESNGNYDARMTPVRFRCMATGVEFSSTVSSVVHGDSRNGRLASLVTGDEVGKLGVEFVSWVDENGDESNAEITKSGNAHRQAKFRCSCDKRIEFVAPFAAVEERRRLCPDCMEARFSEMRRKQGESHRIERVPGKPIDPDGRYIYIGDDMEATTAKEKIIVQDIITGEIFSAGFSRIREGIVKPPSVNKRKIASRYEKSRKYNVGDVIPDGGHIRIVAELPAMEYNSGGRTQRTRMFVFRNLETGRLFDGAVFPIINGTVTGKRANKSEVDYPGVNILGEEDA